MNIQLEQRPRVMKTSIHKITKYVAQRITELGYNVYISFSNKSKSRYLEIMLSKERKLIVRISDHPADKEDRWRFKLDIHTKIHRAGSIDYIEFINIFKQIAGNR